MIRDGIGLALAALALIGCSSMPFGGARWTTLVDGASGLENWDRVGDGNWRSEDGAIVADRKLGKDNGFLVSKQSYGDFRIRVAEDDTGPTTLSSGWGAD